MKDFIAKYATKGTITAVLSVAAIVAGAVGYSPLQAFFADPATADSITQAIGLIGALTAGFMQGVKKD